VHPSPSAPLLGSVLADRYEVLRLIARGGMSEVFEARDLVLQRSVAVKVYRSGAPVDRQRFDAEIVTLASLSHPGLVQVYDAGERDGDGFVVLELIDGPTLREVLKQRGALAAPEVAELGRALAEALAFVHDAGIVHRDVTPSNVLCGADGRPRLADFGIARLLDTTRVTATAMTVGTAAYMSPEQVQGADVTPATDVYSLGLVLIEALTGEAAFGGASHEVAMARLVQDPDIGDAVPAEWRPLLASMTARDPAARPAAAELGPRLALLAASRTAVVGPPSVDGHAVTEAIPVPRSGGTTVMPAVVLPAAPLDEVVEDPVPGTAVRLPSRARLWLALAAVALVVALLASQSGDGIDVPVRTPTTEPVAVTTAPTQPPTTAAPATTAPAPPAGKGKGHGKKDD
jgi:tRNA A-37 threonylcarbamoyl transferase component Bud32